MDETTAFSLVFLLSTAGFCLFALLALAFTAFIFFKIIKRSSNVHQEAETTLSTKNDSYFSQATSRLLTWDTNSLEDFTSLVGITGRSYFGNMHSRGSIKSMTQPEETFDWLVFDLQLKRSKGRMEIHTAERRYELDIHMNNLSQVRVDGIPLGKMTLDGRRLFLLGLGGEKTVGYYDHKKPNRKLAIRLGRYYTLPDYYKPLYSPVLIHGRQVADFNSRIMFTKHKDFVKDPVVPLYRNIAPDINAEEKDWIIALLGLEIWYRIAYDLRARSNNMRV